MGLFDIFTGASAKEAAAKNAALYASNQQNGLNYLNTGYDRSSSAINSGIDAYRPLTALGSQYNSAPTMLLNSLGVNGQAGNDAAVGAFQTSPGYNFQRDQGLQAIDRGAASRGMLDSGNTLMAEQKYGSDLANQEYGNWRNALAGFTSPAVTATAGGAYGTAQGYNTLGALGQTDATNRVNLGTTTASGQANSNTQAANAEMQGSANLWGLGLGALKLFSGFGK